MSNVEDRVVSLSFKNDQFESGVEQSLNSLEKLKSALNFKGVDKAFDDINKTIKASDFSTMAQGVDSISQRFSTMGIVGMTVIQRMTNAAIDFGKKAVNMLNVPIQQMKTGGFNRANVIDQARFKIRGLGMDWQKVREDALHAVEGTAYGLAEAADVAAALGASGVKTGNDMKTSLLAISGAAAQTGRSYSDIGNIFTTVASNGKLMTMQLRQFSASGLNVSATLAKALKKSEAEINEMVTRGEISYEKFATIMHDAFGENAKKANDTYAGSLENVKAALNRVGAAFYEPGIEFMRRTFVDLIPVIDEFKAMLTPITQRFEIFTTALAEAEGIETFFDIIRNGMEIMRSATKPIADAFSSVFGGLQELPKAKQSLKVYTDQIKKYASVTKTVKENGKDTTVRTYDDRTILTALQLADRVKEALEKAREEIEKFTLSQQFLDNLKSVFQGLFSAASIAGKAIKGFWMLLKPLANLAFSVAGAIGRLVYFIHEIANEIGIFDTFFAVIKNIGKYINNISKSFTKLFDWDSFINGLDIANFFSGFETGERTILNFSSIFKMFIDIARTAGTIFAGIIKTLLPLGKVIGAIGSVVLNLAGTFARFVSMALKWVRKSKVITFSFTWLSRLVNVLASGFQWAVTKLGLFASKLGDLGTKTINKVISWIAELIKNVTIVVGFIGIKLYSAINTYAVPAFGSLVGKIKTVIFRFKEYIKESEAAAKVQKAFGKATDTVKSGFSKFGDKLKELFNRFKNTNVFDKLKESFSKLKVVLKELGSGIISKVSDTFHRLISNLKELHLIDKVANGFKFLVDHVTNFLSKIKDNLHPLESFKKLIDPSMFKEMGASALDAGKDVMSFAKASALIGGDKLKERASGAGNGIAGVFKSLVETIKNNPLTDILTEFKKKLQGLDIDKTIDRGIGITKIIATLKLVKQAGQVSSSIASGMSNVFESITGFIKGVTTTVSSFGVMADNIGAMADSMRKQLKLQTFKTIAISIGILAGSLYLISKIPAKKLKSSVAVLGGIIAALVGVLILVNKTDVDSGKMQAVGLAFAGLGASLLMVAVAAKIFAKMKPTELIKSGIALVAFMTALAASVKMAGQVSKRGALTFAGMALAVALLVPAILLMSKIPIATMLKGGAAIFSFIVLMGLAGRAASKDKVGAWTFIGMAAAITSIIPAIVLLSLLPFGRAMKAAATLAIIMMSLGTAIRIAGNSASGALSTIALGAAVVALTTSLMALALIPFGRLAKAVTALSATMLALAATAKLMSAEKKSIASMALIFGIIAGSVYLMASIKADVAIKSMVGIAALLVAVALTFKILDGIKVSPALIGTIALVVAAMDLLLLSFAGIAVLLGKISQMFPGMKKAMEEGIKIINLVGRFINALISGLFGIDTNSSIGQEFSNFIKDLTPGLNALKNIDSSVTTAAKNVAEACMYIGAANFLDWFNSSDSSAMEEFADHFTSFLTKLAASKDDINSFDDATVTKMNSISKMIKALGEAAVEIPATGGLKQGILGAQDLSEFATQLFGDQGFIPQLKSNIGKSGGIGISEDVMSQIKGLATNVIKPLGEAASAIPNYVEPGTLLAAIKGSNDISNFAEEIFNKETGFVATLKKSLGKKKSLGITPEAVSQVKMVATIVKALGEAADKIPEGLDPDSISAKISGAKSLPKFAEGMASVGEAMPGLIKASEGLNEDAKTRITIMASIIKVMGASAAELPDGKIWDRDFHFDQLSSFASKLKDFAPKFKEFADEAGKIGAENLSKVDIVAKAAKALALAAKRLDEGGASVSTDDWKKLASGAKTFVKELGGADVGNIDKNAKAVASAAKSVVEALKKTKGAKGAGSNIISNFIKGLSTKDKNLAGKGTAAGNEYVSGLKATKGAKGAGTALLNSFKQGLGTKGVKAKGTAAGNSYVSGIKATKGVKSAGESLANSAKNGAGSDDMKGKFNSAGQNVAQGFINGLTNGRKVSDAYEAGKALGKKAVKGVNKGAGNKSPSKLTRQSGRYIGEGLVIGIDSYQRKVYKSSENLGRQSVLAMDAAVNGMNADLNMDPTITPVVDLTNIERGANEIDSIISNSTGNINPQMLASDLNRQNGVNSEMMIVNKLDKLAYAMSNQNTQPSESYSFGDITLDVKELSDVTTLNEFVNVLKKARAFN